MDNIKILIEFVALAFQVLQPDSVLLYRNPPYSIFHFSRPHHGAPRSIKFSKMSNGSLPGWGPEAGMTTMLNPLDTEKILIFSTNRNRTLALEHRKIGGDINYKKGSAELPAPGPQLAYPSSLVSFVLDGSVSLGDVLRECS